MPQIEQLPYIFSSQLFWLLVVFGLLFFGIGRGMLPKIQSTVALREQRIAEDLSQAQQARAEAEETEAAYRARMDASRAKGAKLTQEAKQASARETEAKVRAASEQIAARIETAEAEIHAAAEQARGQVEAAAVEATQDMVQRLAGIRVDRDAAARAVKAELNG